MNFRLLVFALSVGLAQTTPQTPATARSAMSVDDVIKMVQVKLADDLIISQIRRNGKPFALSADDMVRLKTTGASDNVIRVLLDPQASVTPPASVDATVTSPATTTPALAPLPSSYGYYILDGQKMSELGQAQVVTTFGLKIGDRGWAVDGLSGQQPTLKVGSPSPTIIVYQQNVSPSSLQLSALAFVRSMKAYEFNPGTAPQFFSNVYRKDPNETIPIDLWRPSSGVKMRIEPVEGKTGMYKLVPGVQLEVGKYALYFPDSIHANDIAFSASPGRQATAYAFDVVKVQRAVENSPGGQITLTPERMTVEQKNKGLNDAFNAGIGAINNKQWDAAVQSLQRATELGPNQTAVWAQLAEAYTGSAATKAGQERTDLYDKGSAAFKKAIELTPDDGSLRNNYALMLARANRLPEAQEQLERAAQVDPKKARTYRDNWSRILQNSLTKK